MGRTLLLEKGGGIVQGQDENKMSEVLGVQHLSGRSLSGLCRVGAYTKLRVNNTSLNIAPRCLPCLTLIRALLLVTVLGNLCRTFALSCPRYKAIVRPMDIQASHALMKICLKAALIWIISMILAIPEAVFSDLHPFHEESTNQTFISCAPYPHSSELHPKIHSMASFLIFYIIPLSIISVYYYFIAKNLIQSAYNLPVEGNIYVKKQVGA